MINKIKIYGERNSGTNFLGQLLKSNLINVSYFHPGHATGKLSDGSGWKHGKPNFDFFKSTSDTTLFIFLIRDLESWLASMYKCPYHISFGEGENDFLTNKLQVWNTDDQGHDMYTNPEETNKTIFELRYYKIKSYIEMLSRVENAIFLNLSSLNKDGGHSFLNNLNSFFGIEKCSEISPVEEHTKSYRSKNISLPKGCTLIYRDIDVNFPYEIINSSKDPYIEKFVEDLKQSYFIKSNCCKFLSC